MRRASENMGLIMLFGVMGLVLFGCSGSGGDPLDEIGTRYFVRELIIVRDGDEDRFVIDPTTTDVASIEVVFESASDHGYDLFLKDIVLDFVFLGDNNPSIDPPELGQIRYDPKRFIPKNGGTLTMTLYFFTALDKDWYVTAIGGEGVAETYVADYRVNITAHGSYSQESSSTNITIKDNTWFTIAKPVEEEEE
ncbi:MAG: hypothetical protein KFF50_03750 [Desulfatitalea sp.]|nr:hypothetical protein [Desulfatitalea sp.]